MAYKNKIITNPVTGQQVKFILTSRETRGALLEMESTWSSQSIIPPLHYHPTQTEYFTVLSGELTVRIGNKIKILEQGDRLEIPPGQVHAMWNDFDQPVIANWKIFPAMNSEQLLETGMGLARDGKVNKAGMPCILQSALIAKHFSGVFRLARPAFFIQRIIFALLSPIAVMTGCKPTYKRYLD